MKMPIFIVAILGLFVACEAAQAQITSGEEMLTKCKQAEASLSSPNFSVGFCAGFITAALETLSMWEASDVYMKRTHDKDAKFCLPSEVTNGQVVRVFVKYLEDHPEKLHQPATALLVEALRKAFPCKT